MKAPMLDPHLLSEMSGFLDRQIARMVEHVRNQVNEQVYDIILQAFSWARDEGYLVNDTSPTELASQVLELPIVGVHRFVKCWASDWSAIYLDGVLLIEGHSVDAGLLLDALAEKFSFQVGESFGFSDAQMDALGCTFPELLEDALTVLEEGHD